MEGRKRYTVTSSLCLVRMIMVLSPDELKKTGALYRGPGAGEMLPRLGGAERACEQARSPANGLIPRCDCLRSAPSLRPTPQNQ